MLVGQRIPGRKDAGSFAKKGFKVVGIIVQVSLPGQHDEQSSGTAF